MRHIHHSLYLFLSHAFLSSSIDTHDKWSSVYDTPLYSALPSCAQPCIASLDTDLRCWSYGCVCSESTPGVNFVNATRFIETCVHDGCQQAAGTALGPTLNAFQSVCGVPFFNLSAAPTATSQLMSATLTAVPTATFDSANAVLVDTPGDEYNALDPCVRWVLNNGKGHGDNSDNSKPRVPGDHSKLWSGLGVATLCTNAECLCSGARFYYSTQKLYDAANYFCSIGFPTQGNASNPEFVKTIQMLADYCSKEGGYVLGEWIVSLVGYSRNTGMTQETKVSIGVGVASGVVTVVSTVIACATYRRAKRASD